MQDIIDQGFNPVIYIEDKLLMSVSPENRDSLLETISKSGLRVFGTKTAKHLLSIPKVHVFRYGSLDDIIARKLINKGSRIVSGNL